MATDYIDVPLEADPAALAADAFAYIEAQAPGWSPQPGNLETWIIEATARIAGDLMYVASQVPPAIFRTFGERVLSLPAAGPVAAQAAVTFTMVDTAGYTIPAGTLVGIREAGGQPIAFATLAAATCAPGAATIPGVAIEAVDPGTAANGLPGVAELIDSIASVDTVAVVTPPTGGSDGETDDEYLDRLSAYAALLAPRPIVASDFAAFALTVDGVARATALDLYDPAHPSTPTARCVTVIVMQEDGTAVPVGIKAEVLALLQARREANFLVFVEDPSTQAVSVTCEVIASPGTTDLDAVRVNVEEAIARYLTPAGWGDAGFTADSTAGGVLYFDTHVRYLEVAEIINRAPGVWRVVSLSIDGGTSDVALADRLTIPSPGAVSVTVTA